MTVIRQSDKAFGLTFAAVFAVIAVVGLLFFSAIVLWAVVASIIFLAVALSVPLLLLPFNRLWAGFAHRLGIVSNFILLGVFFYIFILPAGLLMRLSGRDPMRRTFKEKTDSYFTPVNRHADAETLSDMF